MMNRPLHAVYFSALETAGVQKKPFELGLGELEHGFRDIKISGFDVLLTEMKNGVQ